MRCTRTTTLRARPPTPTIAARREATGTAGLALNTWTHLATTYDGTTLRLFVNGAQVASQAVPGAIVASTGHSGSAEINVWGEYFAGLIDEVRIYNRALCAPRSRPI